jgi:carbon storage regulator
MIGDDVEVTVLSTNGETVRLGIQAPSDIPVHRTEIYMEIQQQHREGGAQKDAGSEVELDGRPEQAS